jgi:dihydrofolate synthase/folylpolyglutamate synthase
LLHRLPDHERTGQPPVPTLERVAALAAALNNPQHSFPVIHVTGTNGKGSTVAMIAALLAATGRRVGTYTSPHLRDVTERIGVGGHPVDALELEWALSEVLDVAERIDVDPAWFEAMTLAGFLLLAEAQVDVAVVEVGLLGRWDATNIVDGRVAVVTSVGLDHTDLAGPTLADIAWEKAGIIRRGAPLILGDVPPHLRGTFEAEQPWAVRQLGRDFDGIDVGLRGAHQRANAGVARAAAEAFLDERLRDDLVAATLADLRLPGRFEVLPGHPDVVLDGAHNAAAAEVLRVTLDEAYPRPRNRALVCGALTGRDLSAFLHGLGVDAGAYDVVVTTAPDSRRAIPPAEAARIAAGVGGMPVRAAVDVGAAVDIASAAAGPDGVVVVTGSLYLLNAARARWESWQP